MGSGGGTNSKTRTARGSTRRGLENWPPIVKRKENVSCSHATRRTWQDNELTWQKQDLAEYSMQKEGPQRQVVTYKAKISREQGESRTDAEAAGAPRFVQQLVTANPLRSRKSRGARPLFTVTTPDHPRVPETSEAARTSAGIGRAKTTHVSIVSDPRPLPAAPGKERSTSARSSPTLRIHS